MRAAACHAQIYTKNAETRDTPRGKLKLKPAVPAIACTVTAETGGALDQTPEMLRISVFRVCQEAVNNAVRHGCCRQISVVIPGRSDAIDMSVFNDGREPPDGLACSTRGIDNMRVRAALISGRTAFEHNQGLTIDEEHFNAWLDKVGF